MLHVSVKRIMDYAKVARRKELNTPNKFKENLFYHGNKDVDSYKETGEHLRKAVLYLKTSVLKSK